MSLKPYDEVKRLERRHVVVRPVAARAMDRDAGGVVVNALAGPRVGEPCAGAGGVNAGVGGVGADVVDLSEPSARLNMNPASKPDARHSVSVGAIAMAVSRIVQAVRVARITEAVDVLRIVDAMGVVRYLVGAEDVIDRAAYRPEPP
jgi:hypothetical protein